MTNRPDLNREELIRLGLLWEHPAPNAAPPMVGDRTVEITISYGGGRQYGKVSGSSHSQSTTTDEDGSAIGVQA